MGFRKPQFSNLKYWSYLKTNHNDGGTPDGRLGEFMITWAYAKVLDSRSRLKFKILPFLCPTERGLNKINISVHYSHSVIALGVLGLQPKCHSFSLRDECKLQTRSTNFLSNIITSTFNGASHSIRKQAEPKHWNHICYIYCYHQCNIVAFHKFFCFCMAWFEKHCFGNKIIANKSI